MSTKKPYLVTSYLVAGAGVLIAGLAPLWLSPLTDNTPPMRLMLIVVVGISGWLGGLGPGLFATITGCAAIIAANDAPGNWSVLSTRLLRFGPLALLITVLFESLHASRRRTQIKEREFRRSEGRYRRLIEMSGQGIWLVDETGRSRYANPRLGEILGMTPAQIVGLPLSRFLVAEDTCWAELWAQTDSISWREIRLRGAHGAVRNAIITSQRVGPEDVPDIAPRFHEHADAGGLLLMVTDVTPLKKAERLLREKESVLRSFYDSSQMAMGVVELTGQDAYFVSANTLCDEFFGVAAGKLEGKSFRELKVPPEMLTTWMERFHDCRTTGRPVRFEYQATCASSPPWLAATLSPMDSLEPARELCSFVAEDITDRKRTEVELLDAKEGAEAASHAKDRFLAVLSHELRTPLTPVLIAVGSLLESKPEGSLRQTLEMIRRNIELEARLIDDLLDLTRISRGRLRLELEVIDIHKLVSRAMEVCRDEALVAGLQVLTNLKAPHHHVMADHARIMQVVWNLIRNAAKFSPGGKLTIRTINPSCKNDRTADDDTEWLIIEFADTGVGIDPGTLPRIFDPFERGNDDTRIRSGGLGLGLTISRSLAEALGGRLTASSSGRGQGSTFRLELKAIREEATTNAPSPNGNAGETSPAAPSRNDLQLLVVEDNKDTLRYLATALRKRGHQVATADCYTAALAAFQNASVKYDLVISDIELPDGDGLQLMREIQATKRTPGIAMSGFGAEEDLRNSREAGFFDHLTKPIDLKRLDSVIQHAIAGGSDRKAEAEDEAAPFSLRSDGNSSGAFRFVWPVEPK